MNLRSLSAMWAVVRKELLDISRDRRTLAIALLLGPLLYPLLMAGYLFALAYVASFITYRVALALTT